MSNKKDKRSGYAAQAAARARKIHQMRLNDDLPEKPKYDPTKEVAARATGQRYIPRNDEGQDN